RGHARERRQNGVQPQRVPGGGSPTVYRDGVVVTVGRVVVVGAGEPPAPPPPAGLGGGGVGAPAAGAPVGHLVDGGRLPVHGGEVLAGGHHHLAGLDLEVVAHLEVGAPGDVAGHLQGEVLFARPVVHGG